MISFNLLFGAFFTGIGVYLLLRAMHDMNLFKKLQANGIESEGAILNKNLKKKSDDRLSEFEYEFKDSNNETFKGRFNQAYQYYFPNKNISTKKYKEGDPIRITYLKDCPKDSYPTNEMAEAKRQNFQHGFITGILGVIAGLYMATTVLY